MNKVNYYLKVKKTNN